MSGGGLGTLAAELVLIPQAGLGTLDIGVDIDNVCYDMIDVHRAWRHAIKGVPFSKMPAPRSWNYYEKWGMTAEEFMDDLRQSMWDGWMFQKGHPMTDTQWALNHLADQGHRIHYITDRSLGIDPTYARDVTQEWLNKHHLPCHSLTISGDKTARKVDIFIDDRVKNYDELEAAGHRPILFTRPWNDHALGRRRVDSWSGFIWHVDTLSNSRKAAA